MRPDLWMWRSTAVRAYLVVAALIGALSGFDGAYDVSTAVAQALGAARTTVLLVGPLVIGSVWGSAADAGLEESRYLAGFAVHGQRRRILLACVVLMVLGCVVSVAFSLPMLLVSAATGESADQGIEIFWPQVLTYLTLVVLAVSAATTALCCGRSTVQATTMAGALAGSQALVFYAGTLPASAAWTAMWPGTAAGMVAGVGAGHGPRTALTAAVCLIAWGVAARARLWIHLPPARETTTETRWNSPTRWRHVACAAVLATVAGAALPATFRLLPAESQPYLLVQRSDGRAPEQVTESFFDYLAAGEPTRAARLTAPSRGERFVEELPAMFAARSLDSRFTLQQVHGFREADVSALVAAGELSVSLLRVEDEWRINGIEVARRQ